MRTEGSRLFSLLPCLFLVFSGVMKVSQQHRDDVFAGISTIGTVTGGIDFAFIESDLDLIFPSGPCNFRKDAFRRRFVSQVFDHPSGKIVVPPAKDGGTCQVLDHGLFHILELHSLSFAVADSWSFVENIRSIEVLLRKIFPSGR